MHAIEIGLISFLGFSLLFLVLRILSFNKGKISNLKALEKILVKLEPFIRRICFIWLPLLVIYIMFLMLLLIYTGFQLKDSSTYEIFSYTGVFPFVLFAVCFTFLKYIFWKLLFTKAWPEYLEFSRQMTLRTFIMVGASVLFSSEAWEMIMVFIGIQWIGKHVSDDFDWNTFLSLKYIKNQLKEMGKKGVEWIKKNWEDLAFITAASLSLAMPKIAEIVSPLFTGVILALFLAGIFQFWNSKKRKPKCKNEVVTVKRRFEVEKKRPQK